MCAKNNKIVIIIKIIHPGEHSYLESVPKTDIHSMSRFAHKFILLERKLSLSVHKHFLKAVRNISNKPYKKKKHM